MSFTGAGVSSTTAGEINASLDGRLYSRWIFVTTLAFAGISILASLPPIVLYLNGLIEQTITPLLGSAASHVAPYARWSVQPLFCVWIIVLVRWTARRLDDTSVPA